METNNNNHSSPGDMYGAAASAFGIGRPQGGAEPTEELPPMRYVVLITC
jgi:hypothetical protein